MYQVGLMETDTHIQYFWRVLESFTAEQLNGFIKLASNQERLPHTCPCRDGGTETAHVPPYPMKIAPPDRPGIEMGRGGDVRGGGGGLGRVYLRGAETAHVPPYPMKIAPPYRPGIKGWGWVWGGVLDWMDRSGGSRSC